VDVRIQRTIERMERQLQRRWTVTQLAGAAGMSTTQLTRLFRQATGTTPGAFLRALRMTRARLLLERTSLSMAEVMAQVGSYDPSRFVRDFQRAHGVAPSAVREQLKLTGA
jgi:AraC family transcriptional regulator, arabinose operon regulatory protein